MEKSKADEKVEAFFKKRDKALKTVSEGVWEITLARLLLELLTERESITRDDLIAHAKKSIEADEREWFKVSYEECIRQLSK